MGQSTDLGLMNMQVVLVVAMSENRVIGRDGGLPWQISADLKHFKKVTMGSPIIMGRKTWDSIGRALPGRRNIVITRNTEFMPEGADTVTTIDAALALCRDDNAEKAMIIGGGQIYAETIKIADVIELTEVHETIDGDTVFPEIDASIWQETSREKQPSETPEGPTFSFVTLRRR